MHNFLKGCVAVWVARFSLSWLNINSELQQPTNIDHAIMQLPSQQVFFHIKTWAIIMGVNWMIRAMKTTTFLHYFIWRIWCHFFTYIMDNVSIPGYTNKRSLSFITFMTHLYCQELMSATKRCKGVANCHTFVVPSSVEFSASKTCLIR